MNTGAVLHVKIPNLQPFTDESRAIKILQSNDVELRVGLLLHSRLACLRLVDGRVDPVNRNTMTKGGRRWH